MRYARLALPNGPTHVRLDGPLAWPLDAAPWLAPESGLRGPEAAPVPWSPDQLLVPCSPTKIVCVGRNYAGHAKELGNEVPAEPLLFFKPPSSLLADGGAILVPPQSKRVEHEGELAIVLGARGRRMTPLEAEAAVFGVTVANDVTARDLQRSDGQWTRAKGFDTFCPVGPWIETGLDTKALRVMCRVNGQTRQDGRTTQMIFDVPTIVAYVSSVMTLERGDVILTGTPEGVGPLAPGDVCEVELQEAESGRSVCLLRSQVRAE